MKWVYQCEFSCKSLTCYHLVKATLDNVCVAVTGDTAQQTFLQQAAALIVERKSHFIVNWGDLLIPILQGTSSLPQLYTALRVLITRIKLGVKAWKKYIAEFELQVGATTLSLLSTLHCWVPNFFYSSPLPSYYFNPNFFLLSFFHFFTPTTHSHQLQASSFPSY